MQSPEPPTTVPPIALAIDIGSSSVRALLYDASGTQVEGSEAQHAYRQRITDDGGSESNPVELTNLAIRCVDEVVAWADNAGLQVAAIGITSFWHGLLGLGVNQEPVTPVYMWSDKRSGDDAAAFAREVDARLVHLRTGCRIHSSYWPAKLRWWQRTQASSHPAVRWWVSITDYLTWRLLGPLDTSISMASGTGLLNGSTLDWDESLIALLEIERGMLPAIVDRDAPLPDLLPVYAARWPSLAGVPWFPAIGDGAAANAGAGCVTPDAVALTIGTSAAMRVVLPVGPDGPVTIFPERIWCYRLDRDHQVLGGALSNGGNVTGWLAHHLFGQDFESLTREAAQLKPDGHGLTVLPLLAGERSPSWRENATATFHGLRLSTSPSDVFRACLEATAYRLAAMYDDLKSLASGQHAIMANGAAALGSPLWLQVIADTLGHTIDAVEAEAEASARGAALCALAAIGARPGLEGRSGRVATSYQPDATAHATYGAARKRQRKLEEAIECFE